MTKKTVKPFVKWVGGKRQLLTEIKKHMPDDYAGYYEPFVGGGAVFLNEQPPKAVINDFNEELVNTYRMIQSDVDELLDELRIHDERNTKDYFYDIRALDREDGYSEMSDVKRAARLIFLNKTCFNGLYRVNASGYFNTPYGRYKNPNIVNEDTLRQLHDYFNTANITFKTGDFAEAVSEATRDDFVYFDPPYAPLSPTSNYTGYTLAGFNEADQIRLKETCDELHQRGAKFLLSNSNVPFIQELYNHDDYIIEVVGAKRSINSKGNKRGEVEEVLIRNYK